MDTWERQLVGAARGSPITEAASAFGMSPDLCNHVLEIDCSIIWYANHLSKNWTKWTNEEAAELFRKNGLTGPIWSILHTGTRF